MVAALIKKLPSVIVREGGTLAFSFSGGSRLDGRLSVLVRGASLEGGLSRRKVRLTERIFGVRVVGGRLRGVCRRLSRSWGGCLGVYLYL